MTVLACVGYWLAVLVRSQRYVAPLGLYVLGVVVFTANDNGPIMGDYAGCAAALFLATLWVTIALVGAEDPVQRAITVVNARGPVRPLAGIVLVALLVSAVVTVFGLVFPALSGDHSVPAVAVLAGTAVQLCAALAGIAAGLVCSRLVVARTAASLGAALAVAFVAYFVPWVSPLRAALHVSERHRPPGELLAPLAGLAAVAAVLVLVAAVVGGVVASRRS